MFILPKIKAPPVALWLLNEALLLWPIVGRLMVAGTGIEPVLWSLWDSCVSPAPPHRLYYVTLTIIQGIDIVKVSRILTVRQY